MPTYKEQRDKIIEAYFRDEIKPMDGNFCFCGTLHTGDYWRNGDENYTAAEYNIMENALLFIGDYFNYCKCGIITERLNSDREDYESVLFEGMSNALDVLKEIHHSRGENVDETTPFTKRSKVPETTNKD